MDDQRVDPVVLLVDDDEMARFLYRQALEPAGFEIVEAADGAAALEAVAITLPDIVVLDVMLPQMDGFAVCRAIRAMPAGRNTPILMATGLNDVESIEMAYDMGATDFITKPINSRLLWHRLRYMLRAYRLAEAERIAGVGYFRWTQKTQRVECSPELSRIFGLPDSIASHPARTLLTYVFPGDRPALLRAVRNALRGERVELDHRIVTSAGDIRTLLLRAEVIGAEGAAKSLQGSYQDITERKGIESELRATRDAASSASAGKKALATGISRQLRPLLTLLIELSDRIAQEALGPISQRNYIEFACSIRSAGRQALANLARCDNDARTEIGEVS